MELKNQVCSLELAQKLKSLGVRQESAFAWRVTWGTFEDGNVEIWGTGKSIEEWEGEFRIAAYTVAELGELLPSGYSTKNIGRNEGMHEDYFECEFTDYKGYKTSSGAENEADARAKMLIYLIENNLLTPSV